MIGNQMAEEKATVIMIYDESEQSADTLTLASFLNELPDVSTGMELSREEIAQHIDNERQSWDKTKAAIWILYYHQDGGYKRISKNQSLSGSCSA
jgi:hypothetical protein